nr:hypothetical protein [Tanacetum cinerariifolium]
YYLFKFVLPEENLMLLRGWLVLPEGFSITRQPRNQDNRIRNQDNSRRTVNVEEVTSNAIVAIDGAGFDWSFMADDEVPTNMDLMAFSDSELDMTSPWWSVSTVTSWNILQGSADSHETNIVRTGSKTTLEGL